MPLDTLPEKLVTPTRDAIISRYERDWQLRNPAAKVGANTEPGIKARILADQLLPLYGEAARNAQVASLDDMDGDQLEDEADSLGLPRRLDAAGASGSVIIGASLGGGTIFAGDEIKDTVTGLRYQCTATAVYTDGQQVPIAGVDTGLSTNVVAGRLLKWTSNRPGISADATVAAQTDGSGLTGGRGEETDDEIRLRIRDARANPAVAGNDADYRAAALRTPNLAIQAVFTFPALDGAGTIGLAFTVRPATPGASRLPNPTQIAAVRAAVVGEFPKDDGLISLELVAQPVAIALRVSWATTAKGWTDLQPWPSYDSTQPIYVSAATSPTSFTLETLQGSPAQPQVGQTLAFYDATAAVFRRKKILSFTGTNPWVVTCDTANGASDLTLTPAVNAKPSPWSDSLDALVPPIVAYFDLLGPGEQVSPFFDAGSRQKRSPESPASWPSVLSGRLVTPLYALPAIADVQLVEPTLPYATTVGVMSVSSNLLSFSTLSAYPL